jgi:hypothetical protein
MNDIVPHGRLDVMKQLRKIPKSRRTLAAATRRPAR